jgi:hypothetical protein
VTGWIEPLLNLIRLDRTTVALPVVDLINPENMEQLEINNVPLGGFSW